MAVSFGFIQRLPFGRRSFLEAMECFNDKCVCSSLCGLINNCVIMHPLFEGYRNSVLHHIEGVKPSKRESVVVDILAKIQPPKVSGEQIDRYYSLFRHQGINLDRGRVSKKQQAFHKKFKSIETRKRRNSIHLKPDTSYERRRKKKAQIVAQKLERAKVVVLPLDINSVVFEMLNEPEPNFHYL